MFDSSLRTPVVYEIAVRYQTPMWRAGAMLRAGCMAGFWLLLRPVMPLIVALILFAILGYPVYWQHEAVLALLGIWAATNVYDRRHPKLGHPPFDWRRVRPWPRPWAAESQTLLAAGESG